MLSLATALFLLITRLTAGQTTGPVRVSTAEELQEAIDTGATNVVVTEHLDMRGIQPSSSTSNTLLWVQGSTENVQVRSLSPLRPKFRAFGMSLSLEYFPRTAINATASHVRIHSSWFLLHKLRYLVL